MRKILITLIIGILIIPAFALTAFAGTYTVLHDFLGQPDGGKSSYGSLGLVGDKFFGVTVNGGANNQGVLFTIEKDGSDFTILHNFQYAVDGNASSPYASPILSGDTFYGMASAGGTAGDNVGAVYSIGTGGNNFTLMHIFDELDGTKPYGFLTLSGSTLYGTTRNNASAGPGLFEICTDGTGFTVLRHFTYDSADAYPSSGGSLVIAGTDLYGFSSSGGGELDGSVYKIGVDGNGFS
ncbi:choice-of-anchor tandem repeat GloVer-containing protein, partial [Candidatus Auribacterota bacterium]